MRLVKLKNRLYLILCVVSVFSLQGCLEKIDIEVNRGLQKSVAIQAKLIKDSPSSTVEVHAGRIFDFDLYTKRPIEMKSAFVMDEFGHSLGLENLGAGNFYLEIPNSHPDFKVEYGASYAVEVSTVDGRVYTSSFEVLEEVPLLDTLYANHVSRSVIVGDILRTFDYVQFDLATALVNPDGSRPRFKWDIERCYKLTDTPITQAQPKACYITQKIGTGDIALYDANLVEQEYLPSLFLYEERANHFFAEGYYLNVYQESLSENAYKYWDQVQQLLVRSGNMFEAPAGRIITNFTNIDDPDEEVFGFFYPTVRTVSHFKIALDVLPTIPGPYCPPPTLVHPDGRCAVPLCCDCATEPGSETSKPEYWED